MFLAIVFIPSIFTDINECCSKKKSCHPDAECMNVVGSFYCRCRHGYTGDGLNCVGNK